MSRDFFTLDDFDLEDKTVLLRMDINSPIDPTSGRILDDTRMRHHLGTINDLMDAKVVILAHQSRPGKSDFTTLRRHADRLAVLLRRRVQYADDLFGSYALGAIRNLHAGDVLLLENTRMYAEDVALSKEALDIQANSHLVRKLSTVADYFVMDAFAAAHRSQPSITGFAEVIPALAGKLMERELVKLCKMVESDDRPSVAILGGLKIDDSIKVMSHMLETGQMDKILTTGVVGTVFLMASGVDVGKPNIDFLAREVKGYKTLVETAKGLLEKFPENISIPTDVAYNKDGRREGTSVSGLPVDYPIMDIGLDTVVEYSSIIKGAKNILLNGPSGVFELEDFSIGTVEIFNAIAESSGYSVLGGGHTAATASQLGLGPKVGHISTGGGALINFLAGKTMPAIEALKRSKVLYGQGHYR